MSAPVYKILRPSEWEAAKEIGVLAGSPDDVRDGFIHLSTAEQLRATAQKHFARETPLILLAMEAESLGDALRWEVSRGGQKFPHLYAELPLSLVKSRREIRRGSDGLCVFPPEIP